MSDPVISIQGLVKRYGNVQALAGVTLDIPPGPVGLLGPNGAGKTTMIKLLLGLLVPDEGCALVAGCDPTIAADRLRVRTLLGYMPEGDCLLPNTTAVELVTTLARLTGLTPEDAMTRAHEVLDYVELDEARYRKAVEFSTGMKQRMKLAQALVHDPQVLLLDEPTNGLDPKGRKHMLDLIEDLGRSQKKNVLLCSHLLKDVEKTCDHVIVLDKGSVAETGDVAEMTREDGLTLNVTTQGDPAPLQAALQAHGLSVTPAAPNRLRIHLTGESQDADEVFSIASTCQAVITALEPERSTLEQVFLRAVGVSTSDAAPKEVER